jgi:DtxR family Mn-dependent transcriptional regulator
MKTPTASIQDYLKAIYQLAEDCAPDPVSPSLLAERLGVARPSVTGMLQRLASARPKLVDYVRYRGVQLTPAGEKMALEVIRHHRLIESYLTEVLDFPWDEVHPEADRLEHVISEALEERIAEKLGHPAHDPHGQPIPARDGTVSRRGEVRLADLQPGEAAVISRVSDRDPDLLRYLDRLGLRLSTRLAVTERAPFDGPLHVCLEDRSTHALGQKAAEQIFVLPIRDNPRSTLNGES